MKQYLMNEKGANEIVTTGLVILFGVVVAVGAFVLIDPVIDNGMSTLTSKITSVFNSINGL
ncbi:hypothetical protein ACTHPH_21805 [Paenibacillus pasadenensis]|nr:hypothetical protein [Paenibacillus pasadenensis]